MSLPFKGFGYEATSLMTGQGPALDGRRKPCSDLEMNAVECLEAYGVQKGTMVCSKFFEDLSECKQARIRKIRAYIMREERYKQVVTGKRSWANRWGTPYAYDSFISGTFFP